MRQRSGDQEVVADIAAVAVVVAGPPNSWECVEELSSKAPPREVLS